MSDCTDVRWSRSSIATTGTNINTRNIQRLNSHWRPFDGNWRQYSSGHPLARMLIPELKWWQCQWHEMTKLPQTMHICIFLVITSAVCNLSKSHTSKNIPYTSWVMFTHKLESVHNYSCIVTSMPKDFRKSRTIVVPYILNSLYLRLLILGQKKSK